jgi:anti-sigma factor RsiW
VSDERLYSFTPGAPPDEATLLAYFEGRLSPEAQRAVEEWLSDEGPEADAFEGLQSLPTEETRRLAARINSAVDRKTKKPITARKGKVMQDRWVLLAVLIVLVLCVLGYAVLKVSMKK